MGDISVEPSMEDILSSIKRIIAEEGDAVPIRQRRPGRPPAAAPRITDDGADEHDTPEVLELDDPMPEADAPPVPKATTRRDSAPAAASRAPAPVAEQEPIVSHQAAAATRGSLEALSRLVVKPEPSGDGTLEGLVREMLRPMLRDWLETNLPDMVESMVAREIAKITAQAR